MTVHEAPWGATREWYTPRSLFDALGLRFDLDPASPMSGPVPWVPADKFYSPRENGLAQPWRGRVWLNPPYGPPGIAFVQKMVEHGHGIMLVPARTETRWFQYAATNADVVTFLRDRLHFIREDGYQARASFASVLMGFGPTCRDAVAAADLGWTPYCDALDVLVGEAEVGHAANHGGNQRVAQLVHPPKANLTIAETAVRLALSRNLIKQGRLRAVRVSPKRLAVTPREVDAYVAARR